MKIVHAADLHIDSPLRGLARYDGAPTDRVRLATRASFTKLVDLCLAEDAKLLLLAGDLFDGEWKDYGTGLFFDKEVGRLREIGTVVCVVRGNHDAESRVMKSLRAPAHVKQFDWKKPETRVFETLGVAIHGQSYENPAVASDLSLAYPAPLRDLVNIGMLHTSLDGREGHAPYAPTTAQRLTDKGYDYWALGHVHAREVVSSDPWIVIPGNLQGRHVREPGPKGAMLVEIDGTRIATASHVPLDVVRWAVVTIDVGGGPDLETIADLATKELVGLAEDAESRVVAARVRLTGTTDKHGEYLRRFDHLEAEVRRAAHEALGDGVFLESIVVATHGASARRASTLGAVLARPETATDVADVLARAKETALGAADALAELREALAPLFRKLPDEAREVTAILDDERALRELLSDAESELREHFEKPGSE